MRANGRPKKELHEKGTDRQIYGHRNSMKETLYQETMFLLLLKIRLHNFVETLKTAIIIYVCIYIFIFLSKGNQLVLLNHPFFWRGLGNAL